jgi:hypothetical protein
MHVLAQGAVKVASASSTGATIQAGPVIARLTRVPQLEQRVKIVSEESGFSSGAVYEGS